MKWHALSYVNCGWNIGKTTEINKEISKKATARSPFHRRVCRRFAGRWRLQWSQKGEKTVKMWRSHRQGRADNSNRWKKGKKTWVHWRKTCEKAIRDRFPRGGSTLDSGLRRAASWTYSNSRWGTGEKEVKKKFTGFSSYWERLFASLRIVKAAETRLNASAAPG